MIRSHQPGSQPLDIPETIPNPAVPRTVPTPSPRPSEPVKVPAPQRAARAALMGASTYPTVAGPTDYQRRNPSTWADRATNTRAPVFSGHSSG
jgi:hypothetical protein